MSWYEYSIIILYGVNTFLLYIYGFHYYLICYLYYRKKGHIKSTPQMKETPQVTIQLPIFNELYVAERLIRKVMSIDYPKEKLEIQVLDDSTDETKEILSRLVAEYKGLGYDINHVYRTDRVDHKAGALREGLTKAKGEFIAIFDSDFLPANDFLLKTLPHFTNAKIGMVQTRWGHVNQDYSMLTKAQSLGIDGHFMLEQTARSDYGLWLNFNGTAGIWRKTCILDAGNWTGDTLTEDLDLSYRAQLKGWEFTFLQDVVSPAELPVEMTGYKTQQFRWAKGSIQTAIKLMWKMLRSDHSWKKKLEGVIHLTYYTIHPLMLINFLLSFPLLLAQQNLMTQYSYSEGFMTTISIALVLMVLVIAAPTFFMLYSQKEITGSWTKRLKWFPYIFLVGLGIAIHISKAYVEAIIGKKSPFIRTPKFNLLNKKEKWLGKKYNIPIHSTTVLEIIAVIYALVVTYYAFSIGVYLTALFPILFAISFSYIAFTSIYQSIKHTKAYEEKRSLNS